MTERRHVLAVTPQAVDEWWIEATRRAAAGEFTPWPHQRQFLEWLGDKPAALAAIGMGGGKTPSALLAAGLSGVPSTPLLLTTGPTNKRAERLRQAVKLSGTVPVVAIANYDAVWRGKLGEAVQSVPWSWIILDESHRIKSPSGRASKWLAALAAKNPTARRLCLTGTPMPNGPLDLYGQFRFLAPHVLGTSWTRCRSRYAETHPMFPSQIKRYLRQDEFARLTDPFIWRVATEDVLDLPDETHQQIAVELSPATRSFYREFERELIAEIDGGIVTATNALARTTKLRMATSGYARPEESALPVPIDGIPGKRAALRDWMEDLGKTEPLVVFFVFRCDADEIAALCRETGRGYSEVSGREKSLADWQQGKTDVLAVQIRSGSEGIDLTRARHAVFWSVDWSPGVYEQALRRIRRPGQKAACCHYYHLVARDTVDEAVYRALITKQDIIESVLGRLSSRATAVH
jgi:SNF2 family DNA or RNA helicase